MPHLTSPKHRRTFRTCFVFIKVVCAVILATINHPANAAAACVDKKTSCAGWSSTGYCTEKYVAYMANNCQKSCGICTGNEATTGSPTTTIKDAAHCGDQSGSCGSWKGAGYCDATSQYAAYMAKNCRKSCSGCAATGSTAPTMTTVATTTTTTRTTTRTTATTKTAKVTTPVTTTKRVVTTSKVTTVQDESECVDEHQDCGYWAVTGDCDNRKYISYMEHVCKRACGLCATAAPIPNPPKNTPAPAVVIVSPTLR